MGYSCDLERCASSYLKVGIKLPFFVIAQNKTNLHPSVEAFLDMIYNE